MATMRLSDGVINVDFDPTVEYVAPEDRRRTIHQTLNGSLYIYEWGNKKLDEVPVIAIAKADADQLNEWWQDLEELNFYYDYSNYPSTYITVVIINQTRPLQMMESSLGWQGLYSGTLILRQK